MINCGKVPEGFNEDIYWMLPQFQEIKDTSVHFTINRILQGCVGKVGVFKRSDTIVSSICCGSADNIFMNPALDVLSAITSGGCNFQGENLILFYLDFSIIFCMQEGHFRENVV